MMNEWNLEALINKLRLQYIGVNQLRKGDVVVVDSGSWLVDSVFTEPNGFLTVVDKDGNGFVNVPGTNITTIVDRSVFK